MKEEQGIFAIYTTKENDIKIDVKLKNDTVWLTGNQIAKLFNKDYSNVLKHIKNIYNEEELEQNMTMAKFATVVNRGFAGKKEDEVVYYNLDMIIAVGYRVNSKQATQFRIWATKILKEYIIKGFVLDDERLKHDKNTPIEELVARIKDIRASELNFYQKVRDVLRLSSDYRANEEETQNFYANIQNKLLFAVLGKTAAEIIYERVDHKEINMGLTSFRGDIVRVYDIYISKNYLQEKEITQLNKLVNMFLDYVENQVERTQKKLYMDDWEEKTDNFLKFNEYKILIGLGKMRATIAKKKAKQEYNIFDSERKHLQKQKADEEDLKILQESIKNIENKE